MRPSLHENLRPARELLERALANGAAVGAFNFSNLETVQAIVDAANEAQTPAILQASESAIKYMGLGFATNLVQAAARTSAVPLALHLDHGKDFEICKQCIDAGFTSVMIDKSAAPFEENVRATAEVVAYAHAHDVSVEAELGRLPGVEDEINVLGKEAFFTEPTQALEFIERTGIDSLAVSIGTSHGPNKAHLGDPKLDIARLCDIRQAVGQFPLVLHGASSVYPDLVDRCNKHGSDIQNAVGIADHDISEAIKNGIAKINVDTDIRIAFLAGLRGELQENRGSVDLRRYMASARACAKDVVLRKIRMFGILGT